MKEKQYYSIKEVSKILNLKEHVIRYWDSIDPKTNLLRIEGLSIRNKGGKRYFNKENIKKLNNLRNVLFENGKHNYSLKLANQIISSNSKNSKIKIREVSKDDVSASKIRKIINDLRNLVDN